MSTHKDRMRLFLKVHTKDIFIVCVFLAYSIIMTWPFAAHPMSTIVSAPIGDVPNSITKFEAIKNEGLNPFVDGHIQTIAVPDGIKSNVGVDRVSFFSTLALWLPTLVLNSLFAHGLFTFTAYFFTAVIGFFFLKQFTGSRATAFIGAVAMCILPLYISLARAAPVYMHLWLYILPVWAILRLGSSFNTRNLLIAIVSVIPGFFWTPYFSFHIMLIAGSCLLVLLYALYRKHGNKTSLIVAVSSGITWLTLLVVYYLLGKSSTYGEVPERTLKEIYDQSLHPLMLALPGAFTWWGEAGNKLLISLEPRALDTNLYVGITVLVMATLGVFAIIAKKVQGNLRLFGLFAISIFVFTFSFSLAPTIAFFGINIPTPNYLIADYVPALRAGQRLAMPIALSLIMLMSVGLVWLKQSLQYRRVNPAYLLVVFFALLVLDLSSKPPQLTDISPAPSVALTLREKPPGVVAQYINGSITGDPSQIACKLYWIHRKPIINYCGLEIFYPKGQLQTIHQLSALPLVKQLPKLQEFGVEYIIIQNDDLKDLQFFMQEQTVYAPSFKDAEYTVFERK